jgi:hypothetical protein
MTVLIPSGLIPSDVTALYPGGLFQAAPTGTTAATITSVTPSTFVNGQTGIVITGTNFGASQGTGSVVISPTDDELDAAAVEQTVDTWGDESITITAVRGSLAVGTNLYLFVIPDTNDPNASGHVVQFEYVPIVMTWAM